MADIIADTYKLNQYAQRIVSVNDRILRLNRRLDALYKKIGLLDLWDLIQADVLTSYSCRLLFCQSYLQQSALEFEKVERELGAMNPLSFNELGDDNISIFFPDMDAIVSKQSEIAGKYFSILTEYVSGKIENYVEKIKTCHSYEEMIVEWYTWFRDDLYSDLGIIKRLIEDVAEEMTFCKPKLFPGKAEEFFDTLDDYDVLIDVATSLRDWYNTGDGWQAFQDIGLTVFSTLIKKGNKWLDEKDNLKYIGVDKQLQGILLDTIVEMPQKWIEGIKNYVTNGTGTAGSIVTDTVLGSFVESTADAAKPIYVLGTAVTYPVVDQICEAVGYDLSAEYERLTGEKGLKAVFSAQKELWVDVVYEGIKDKTTQAIDGFYTLVSDGWGHWWSGVNNIFGRN